MSAARLEHFPEHSARPTPAHVERVHQAADAHALRSRDSEGGASGRVSGHWGGTSLPAVEVLEWLFIFRVRAMKTIGRVRQPENVRRAHSVWVHCGIGDKSSTQTSSETSLFIIQWSPFATRCDPHTPPGNDTSITIEIAVRMKNVMKSERRIILSCEE